MQRLAIAAIILIAAAIPSLAQTKSDLSSKRVFAAPGSGLDLTFNYSRPSTEIRSSEPKTSVEHPVVPKLSPAMFTADRFSYVNNKMSFTPQFTIYDSAKMNSKRQFRTDDDLAVTASKHRVTFVPSMGQKIPS
jgi:hypothetical protein